MAVNKSMETESKYEGNKILIPLFFKEVLDSFSFLESQFGFSVKSRVKTWNEDELKDIEIDTINNKAWYFSAVRFYKTNTTLTLNYGERESIIWADISYNNEVFGIYELIHAINPNEHRELGNSWVLNSKFLITTVSELASAVKEYWPQIECPSQNLVYSVRAERKVQEEIAAKTGRESEIEHACYLAAQEFKEKNYIRTIELLKEYEKELPKSAMLKLNYARKNK